MDWNIKSKTRYYNRILAQITEVYHDVSLKQGFSDSIMSVLYVLADNDGSCLLAELVRQTGLSKQTVNSALRRLEGEKILCLEPDDGRSKRVRLTEQGAAIAHETVDKIIAAENKIYDSWPQEDWERYVRLTEAYLGQLREEMKEI